jgi:hypothetical protein
MTLECRETWQYREAAAMGQIRTRRDRDGAGRMGT